MFFAYLTAQAYIREIVGQERSSMIAQVQSAIDTQTAPVQRRVSRPKGALKPQRRSRVRRPAAEEDEPSEASVG